MRSTFVLAIVSLLCLCACQVKKPEAKPAAAYGVLERVFGDASHFPLFYSSFLRLIQTVFSFP